MTCAFKQSLPNYFPQSTPEDEGIVDIEIECAEMEIPNHLLVSEHDDDVDSFLQDDASANAFNMTTVEFDLAQLLDDSAWSYSDSGLVNGDSKLRSSCNAHNLQLVVKDALAELPVSLELYFSYLSVTNI